RMARLHQHSRNRPAQYALVRELPPEKLKAVLIHELAHIKRGDLWSNFVQTILQIIYFYNPLVWLVNVVMRRIREQAVDEMVLVTLKTGIKEYSNTLIDIAEMAFLKPNLSLRLIGVVESKKALHRRIRHMFNRPIPKNAKLGIRGLVMILIVGAVLLPMARAQKQSNEKTTVDTDAQPKNKSESSKIDIPLDAKNLHVTKLSDELIEIGILFRNQGSAPIPRFRVNFYAGDPDKGGRLLAPHNSGPIMPGDTWAEGTHPQRLRPGENFVSVVVDPDNTIDESDETNNKVSRTISTTASETEKAHKVGVIQKVNLAGDDILEIETQEAKGFNFPYYLFIPNGIDKDKPIHILVETNNSGTTSDDLDVHRVKAFRLAENSYATRMASRLGVPLLVPTFPRPKTEWWAYTHALDIDTLEIKEGKLKRVDLQLTAMIKHAQELLRFNGFSINDRVFMHGFSASAKFCNRYSYLHPEMVKAVAAGGVNGLPTLPVRETNGHELPFPIGIAGIEKFTDGPFNEEAFRKVAHYIYMGSVDKNDTLPSRDAWREEEADIIKKALAEKMMPDRWELSQKMYRMAKLPAQLVTYNGVGHSIKGQMQDDVINFFRANAGENYVRIKPYEFPSVIVNEGRPKHETGSAKIDIKPEDFKILYDENRGTCRLRVGIQNTDNIVIPRFNLRFYRGDPDNNLDEAGNVQKGLYRAGPIQPGKGWGANTLGLHLPDGQYEFTVVLDFDKSISETDENNNQAVLKVKIENGRIVDQSATYPITSKPKKAKRVETDTLRKQTTQKEEEPTTPKRSSIDIKANDFKIIYDENRRTYRLRVDIQNTNNTVIPGFELKFYRGDPRDNLNEAGGEQGSTYGAGPIQPGRSWGANSLGFLLSDGQYVFTVALDSDNSISEIDEDNNQATLKVKIENGQIVDQSVTSPGSDGFRRYEAKLSDGITVELISVCEHPNEGKQCWRPDGSLMAKAPYKTTKKRLERDEGYNDYEFVMRLTGPNDTSNRWSVPGGRRGTDTGAPMDHEGRRVSDLRLYTVNQPQDKKMAAVRIGVTAAEWETLANYNPKDDEETYTLENGAIAFGVAYEMDGDTLLPVVHNFKHRAAATRVIAISHSGQSYGSSRSGSGGNILTSSTYGFDVPLNDIREFRFMSRPYTWIEFQNVSLRPGVETNVKCKFLSDLR
ncbi:M56 family metallopeptidase, partial [Planctomycetota bacterium]